MDEVSETAKHLWEADHDYYCSDNNYFSRDETFKYNSWAEFTNEGNFDLDFNLVFRWDWYDADKPDSEMTQDELHIYIMHQRIGRFVVSIVRLDKTDEPSVIQWLQPRFSHLMQLWQPFTSEVKTN